jgi:hypothetical protein
MDNIGYWTRQAFIQPFNTLAGSFAEYWFSHIFPIFDSQSFGRRV